jgi:hypothetical protein
VPVKLNRECEWGGWYATNLTTGHAMRIKTAGRLRKQLDNSITARQSDTDNNHNITQEAAMPTNNDAKAARAARRTAKTTTPAVDVKSTVKQSTTPKESTVKSAAKKSAAPVTLSDVAPANSPVKSVAKATPRNANGTLAAKPKAAKAAKPAVTEQSMIDTLIAEAVAKAIAEMTTEVEVIEAAAPAAKPAKAAGKLATPAKSTRTVKLKASAEKRNSWQFKVTGTSKTPLVTSAYISNDALALFENGAKTLDLTLVPHAGNQPKNSIRFTDHTDSLRGGLYVMRNALNGSGITESTNIIATLTVVSEDTVSLAISRA